MALPPTLHGTCLLVGAAGVLIRGRPGAGKSRLALALLEEADGSDRFARLVADDRVHVEACHGRLVARRPETIAGLIEQRGFGLRRVESEPAAVLALIVDLVPQEEVERLPLPEARGATLEGVALPRLAVAEHDPAAVSLVKAALVAMSGTLGAAPAL
jgi:serine kinase of HPr protein (carbohydrate metabolism regulator)